MKPKSGRPHRGQKEKDQMRQRIADHAMTIFRQDGFDALSIRRLAREVGCAPMTIYAHFDGKPAILRYLWGVVLARVFEKITMQLQDVDLPEMRLRLAARCFVSHWLDHPDQFRMVFMSNGVTRSDVAEFVTAGTTSQYFTVFADLIAQAGIPADAVKLRSEALIVGMIGAALSFNTIKDYPWGDPTEITDSLVAGGLRR